MTECFFFVSVFILTFSSIFCYFSSSRTDYVHRDVICHRQTQWDADMEQYRIFERKIKEKTNSINDRDMEANKVTEIEKKKH